ncbi:MAG: CvpA family protein [Flavobacteriaceae bacterium]|nr:CvpA family protein [Flavobacteriaceae bacterium]
MSTIDIILAALLLFGLVKGFMKGLFVEITSLVALVLGLYGAIHFSYFIADFLKDRVDWAEKYVQIIAFASTFVLIVLLISLSGKLLTKLADAASLGIMNKVFGAVFGLVKVGLILSVVLIIFDKLNRNLPFIKEDKLEASLLYKPVKNLAPMIFPSILEKEIEAAYKG